MSKLRMLEPQLKHTLAPVLWALTASLWLCGCAGVSVKSAWQEDVPRNQTFSRLLIVGVTPDFNLRCEFEYAFASQLASPSTKALPSCDSMKANEPLTRENIERVIAAVHADAVLATRLVAASTGVREGGSLDTMGTSLYKPTDFGYGAYGMPVTYVEFETAPPLTTLTSSIHVFTKLYETQGAKLVYTLDTQTKHQEIDSTQATLITITAPIANRLRRDGLIR